MKTRMKTVNAYNIYGNYIYSYFTFIYIVNVGKYDELLMSNASGSDGCAAYEPLGDNMTLWVKATGRIKKRKNIWDGIFVNDVHVESCWNFIIQCDWSKKVTT